MFGCVLSQLKPSQLHIPSREKKPRPSASDFSTAKNIELLGLYPIMFAEFTEKAIILETIYHRPHLYVS